MTPKERKLRLNMIEHVENTRRLARRLPAVPGSRAHAQAVQLLAATGAVLELLVAEIDLDQKRNRYEQQMGHARPATIDNAENLSLKKTA